MQLLREYTDTALEILADMLSQKVIKRGETVYHQLVTPEAIRAMRKIIYGALLACRWNNTNPDAVQGILDYAEFLFNNEFPDYEGYRSVYCPLNLLLDRELDTVRVNEEAVQSYWKTIEERSQE